MKNDDLDISEILSSARSVIVQDFVNVMDQKILEELNISKGSQVNNEIFNEFAVKCLPFINALRDMPDEKIIAGLEKMWESDPNLARFKEETNK